MVLKSVLGVGNITEARSEINEHIEKNFESYKRNIPANLTAKKLDKLSLMPKGKKLL